jgi:hypothetical protein
MPRCPARSILVLLAAFAAAVAGCDEGGSEAIACEKGLLVPTGLTEDYLLVCSQANIDALAGYTEIGGADVVIGFASEEDHATLFCPGGGEHITSLAQLTCLERIDGVLAISFLDQLESLAGLEQLASLEQGHFGWDLKINDNPLLPTCEAERLVQQLQAAGWAGTALIENNDDGAICD